ncbi:unannotated protein [freshwater metagenome]|uniref:Unannotated protein n=1 Tax=freshwater metagenome TaxID=449393 RepID=A0A6J6GUC7_9ZZZZ|nr:CDP-diacylglycerol--glycerol-3-phosphate 3-phosphatidyltransferase [Actinomycetota bacterium]MSY65064.1 CDP-diacylglycerol--glycerol-3-phosphate 3-phosphatidyltransferase [Actinomycetota bacterium]MSZ53863.1 CDP-diacylglycerol--glycerol-3-phosphate 3-phosphatidyltransferase [Actinomycetota bacterium]MTA98552.1 CDP-diacylglycerol--glycerol-3-phosphate 3-phosphatidyltransferase [Actinomycetota bacterium]
MKLTIPNLLTLLRAAGVPIFLYFFLVADKPVISFFIIAIGGVTDYLDGKVARALNQTSEFGAKFDPTVDRLYIGAILIAFALRDYLSWQLIVALILRDLILFILVLIQRIKKLPFAEVTFLGKAATFNLLYAFPLLLLQDLSFIGEASFAAGWAFAIWGVALYFYTGIQYLYRGIEIIKKGKRG